MMMKKMCDILAPFIEHTRVEKNSMEISFLQAVKSEGNREGFWNLILKFLQLFL